MDLEPNSKVEDCPSPPKTTKKDKRSTPRPMCGFNTCLSGQSYVLPIVNDNNLMKKLHF